MGLRADDPRSPYIQIADQLRELIRSGELGLGDQLPTSRELEAQFKVAKMTIKNALDLLRDQGLIYSVQGKGTFVRSDLDLSEVKSTSGPGSADYARIMGHIDRIDAAIRSIESRLLAVEAGQDQ